MISNVLVVMPTLDRPVMCRRAVDSLLRQNFAAWGLVISKNGGPAMVPEYLESLGDILYDKRVRFLISPLKGLGYGINEGARRFIDDFSYVSVLEDDDEWMPNFLPTMVKAANQSCADVIHCKQAQVPEKRQSNGAPMDPKYIRRRNWVNWPECLIRRSMFKKVKGATNEAGPATDWDFHLKALGAGAKYHFVNQVLVIHHWHGENYCINVNGIDLMLKRIEEGVYG